MSSKVYKRTAKLNTREYPYRGEVHGPARGVTDYEPKRRGEPEAPAPAPPPEPKVDLDGIRKQAFQEGMLAGKSAAEKRVAEELAKKAGELGRLFEELAGYKSALRSEAEAELVELAFAVAKRIVRRELGVNRGAVTALVRSCMAEFPAVGVKRVLVHPDDLEMVRGAVPPHVEAVADAGVPRGGAVLETDQGRLDARIETQLDEIALGLADG